MGQNLGTPTGPTGPPGGRMSTTTYTGWYDVYSEPWHPGANYLHYYPVTSDALPLWDGSRWTWVPFFPMARTVSDGSMTLDSNFDVWMTMSVLTPSSTNTTTDVVTFGSAHGIHTGATVIPISSGGGLNAGQLYSFRSTSTTEGSFFPTITDCFSVTNKVDLTASITSQLRFVVLDFTYWTNDTTRATTLATASQGSARLYKSGDKTRLYLGTARVTTVSGSPGIPDDYSRRYLWNLYNQQDRQFKVTDATVSWTYGTSTWRQARANTANCFKYVQGLATDPVYAQVVCSVSSVGDFGAVGIGVDSTTGNSANNFQNVGTTAAFNVTGPSVANYSGFPGIGHHTINWLEYRHIGVPTFYGTNANYALAALTGSMKG